MSLHALDDISDAIDATKSFLLPFAARTWLKLAVVVFFISGGGGGFNIPQSSGNFGGQDQPGGGGAEQFFEGVPSTLHGVVAEYGTELAIIVGLALTLVLVFALLSNFMEFVFAQSLIEREVHVRQYLRENVGNALRLFVFRLFIALVTLTLVLGFLYAVFVTVLGGSLNNIAPGALLGLFPVFIIFFLGLGLVQGLVTGFTNVFVVPMMLTSSRGVLGSWKRLLGSMRRNLKQYLGYLALSIALGIGVGIVGGLLGVVAVLLLAIPFVLVGAVVWFALHGTTLGLAILVITGLLFALSFLLATNLIQVPLQAFLRYYAMLVLGDIDEELDPIPGVRDDIRADEPDVDAAPSEGI